MGREHGHDWRTNVASALEWWRDAGVDTLVEESARDWLARPAPQQTAAAVAETAAPAEALPDTLETFLDWRMGEAAPEAEWLTPRIGPAGRPDAPLMVLTDMPESEDAETGALLSGAAGRLFDRILGAIGESRDSVYLASIATARPLTGQIPADQEARLAELARHHVALAGPKKLLLMSEAANRVWSTTNGSGYGNSLDAINQYGSNIVVAAIRSPRFLLRNPGAKAEAWKQLLQFCRGERP